MQDTDGVAQSTEDVILSRIGSAVAFTYPGEPPVSGTLKDRSVLAAGTIVPYWDVVDLIEFKGESEQWLRIGYYRKAGDRLVWGSQTTITEPISTWKKLLVHAAREKPWLRSLLNEVVKELDQHG